MKELKVTKERVLEAAKDCPTAKEVLNKLFPEVFEDEDWVKVEVGQYFLIYGTELCQLVRFGGKDLDFVLIDCNSGNRYFICGDEIPFIKKDKTGTYISKEFMRRRYMKKVKVKTEIIY